MRGISHSKFISVEAKVSYIQRQRYAYWSLVTVGYILPLYAGAGLKATGAA